MTVTTATATKTTGMTAYSDDRLLMCNGMMLKTTPMAMVRTTTATEMTAMIATLMATDTAITATAMTATAMIATVTTATAMTATAMKATTPMMMTAAACQYDRVWGAAANFQVH